MRMAVRRTCQYSCYIIQLHVQLDYTSVESVCDIMIYYDYICIINVYSGLYSDFARTSSLHGWPILASPVPRHLHELGIAHKSTEHTGIKASWHSHATRHSRKATHATRHSWKASREASWEATVAVASCWENGECTAKSISCSLGNKLKVATRSSKLQQYLGLHATHGVSLLS